MCAYLPDGPVEPLLCGMFQLFQLAAPLPVPGPERQTSGAVLAKLLHYTLNTPSTQQTKLGKYLKLLFQINICNV